MTKFILSYRGFGDSPTEVETRIDEEGELRVVDRFGDNLVVEGRRDVIRGFLNNLRGWFSVPERRVRSPRMYVTR